MSELINGSCPHLQPFGTPCYECAEERIEELKQKLKVQVRENLHKETQLQAAKEENERLKDAICSFIDRANDPIEDEDYYKCLLEEICKKLNPFFMNN